MRRISHPLIYYIAKILTVHPYFSQSDQYRVTENFRLITVVVPIKSDWPTPMIPPAVWYMGRGSYNISDDVMPIIILIPIAAKAALLISLKNIQ